jgi:hypothetical protein
MQKISDEELKLSTIWVALGIARDVFDREFKGYETAHFMLRRDEMQAVRDEIEEQIERLRDLEEIDG